jgi:DNA-binding NtrC family response regulator
MLRQNKIAETVSLLGESEAMRQVRSLIAQVAPTDISVLILGESGTGKELVARQLHELSPRRAKPMLTVNCGAIPEGIFESEIFGHERGAFTGADKERAGYFELADGGTILLDEVGDIPLASQVKLLRVLENGEFMRVGSSVVHRVDVRILAATNRDLAHAVASGQFRQDLFYRLKTVTITVPPLRERREDIPLLVSHFLRAFCRRNHIPVPTFSADAQQILREQYWSGNVRELRNTVETIATLQRGADTITAEMVRRSLSPVSEPGLLPVKLDKAPEVLERELIFRMLLDLRREVGEVKTLLRSAIEQAQDQSRLSRENSAMKLEEMEKEQIRRTLAEYGGNRRKTAQALGIGERTLYRKLKEYQFI